MRQVIIDGQRYIPHPEAVRKWPSIAEALRYLRGLRRLSLDEAAKQAGISKTYLWELEQGKAESPGFYVVAALADLYGVTLDAFPRKPPPESPGPTGPSAAPDVPGRIDEVQPEETPHISG